MLNDQTCTLIESLVTSLVTQASAINIRIIAAKLNGDLRALNLAYSSDVPLAVSPSLLPTLEHLLARTRMANQVAAEQAAKASQLESKDEPKVESQPEPAKPEEAKPEDKSEVSATAETPSQPASETKPEDSAKEEQTPDTKTEEVLQQKTPDKGKYYHFSL